MEYPKAIWDDLSSGSWLREVDVHVLVGLGVKR